MNSTDYILIALLIVLLIVAITSFKIYSSQAGKCIQDPLGYGIKNIEKYSGRNISCMCYFSTPMGEKPIAPFVFDSSNSIKP